MKIALVELDGTHEECLYSQVLHLEASGHSVQLIYDVSMQHKMVPFGTADREVTYEIKHLKGLALFKRLWEIRNYITSNGFDAVVFNTAHGNLTRNFCLLPFPARIRFYGTMHGINKLEGSFTQKLINRKVRHFFLLNDYLICNLSLVPHQGLAFESFYPIDFPNFPGQPVIDKPADEYWIGVPGQVEFKRRDYAGLAKAFAQTANKPKLRFLLLGSYQHKDGNGAEMQALIRELGLEEYFVFTGYLQYPDYHAWIKKCDIIMPLVHPGNDSYIKYLKYQITGGYNLAFAYKKPLLMLEEFNGYEDFIENAVFYSLNNLPEVLGNIPELAAARLPGLYLNPKWDFAYRTRKFVQFIAGGIVSAQ